jgi:hypothetical protein
MISGKGRKMKMTNGEIARTVVLAAALSLLCLIVGTLLGMEITGKTLRGQAVDAKVARWTVNPETGETEFVYGCEHGSVKQ